MRLGTRILSFACLVALLMAGLGFAGGAVFAGEKGKAWTAEELQKRVVDHTYFTGAGKGDNKWRSYIYFPSRWSGTRQGVGRGLEIPYRGDLGNQERPPVHRI